MFWIENSSSKHKNGLLLSQKEVIQDCYVLSGKLIIQDNQKLAFKEENMCGEASNDVVFFLKIKIFMFEQKSLKSTRIVQSNLIKINII